MRQITRCRYNSDMTICLTILVSRFTKIVRRIKRHKKGGMISFLLPSTYYRRTVGRIFSVVNEIIPLSYDVYGRNFENVTRPYDFVWYLYVLEIPSKPILQLKWG